MTTSSNFLHACRTVLGTAHVLTTSDQVAPFLTDWSGRWRGEALAVLCPGSTSEVSEAVRLCACAGIGVVPQGGNTGLSGGATPQRAQPSVVMHLGRLTLVSDVDLLNNTLTVGAGVTLARVQEVARAAGRLFPLSLASEGTCTIGGNLATNAGGTTVLRYGSMRQLCLGLEVVLPDGRIWNGLRTLRKDNTGYSLRDLYIGSEGTLGLITAAVLQLRALPTDVVTCMLILDSSDRAMACFDVLREEFDAVLTTFELISPAALDAVAEQLPHLNLPACRPHPWVVLVECSDASAGRHDGEASSQALLSHRLEQRLAYALDTNIIRNVVIAQSAAQARSLWAIREGVPLALSRQRTALRYDLSFPISALERFLQESRSRLVALDADFLPVVFGHVGDGNLHFNVSPGAGRVNFMSEMTDRIDAVVYGLVRELGGSVSAEHGIGRAKSTPWRDSKSPVELALMHSLKTALDPQGLMNPGIFFPAAANTSLTS
ncbi:FAD-binding oxidoreductase [Thiomonas bhubaneswarensis]|uniref:FAD/FMN-containing dehydrogenase n=1 Tax=Thiomonas bhubaneswarensis TaxID=339866 RepID=A0A0K6I077_9BURK|nr:FAD-binding oxidoreductase [Thiomonas bhubaneswarensis]CUA96535.1 FAD/FMN-containing dehydrogenase [Thiomonas bhubaneswarensis]